VAGAVLNLVDQDTSSHPALPALKLEAVGYGFRHPGVLRSSGPAIRTSGPDRQAPRPVAGLPLFLLAFLVVGALSGMLYAPTVGRRAAIAAGLLQARRSRSW